MFSELSADLQHYTRFRHQGRLAWWILARMYVHPAALAVIWHRLGGAAWPPLFPLELQFPQFAYRVDAVVAGVPARILDVREPSGDASENRTLPNRSLNGSRITHTLRGLSVSPP